MQFVTYLYLMDYVGDTKLHLKRKLLEIRGESACE